jgi:hypothetical protein
MATKKINEMKATIWTANVRSEMSGTIAAVVIEGFNSIMESGSGKSASEMRELALTMMTKRHKELNELGR